MPFDPDQYLQKKTAQGGFDPSAYLASKLSPQEESTGRRYGRDLLNLIGRAAKGDPTGLVTAGEQGLGEQLLGKASAPSELETARLGMLQGATLGHADELAGLAGAVTHLSPSKYTEVRDKVRAEDKAAASENPSVHLASEVAGGMALPIGHVHKAVQALPFMRRLRELGMLGRVLSAGGAGGAIGAGVGGAAAEGSSEAQSPQELAQDVGQGLKTGGVIGTVVPAAGQVFAEGATAAAPLLHKAQDVSKTVELATKPFEKGLQGVRTTVKGTLPKLEESAENAGRFLAEKKGEVQALYSKFLREASDKGTQLDAAKTAQTIRDAAKELLASNRDPEVAGDVQKILSKLDAYAPKSSQVEEAASGLVDAAGNPLSSSPVPATSTPFQLNPTEAKSLHSTFGELSAPTSQPGAKLSTGAGVGLAQKAKQAVGQDLVQQIPGIPEADQKYGALARAYEELGVKNPNLQTFGDDPEVRSQVVQRLVNLATGAERETQGSIGAGRRIENAFSSLEKVSPEATQVKNQLGVAAENYDLARRLSGAGHEVGHVMGFGAKAVGQAGNLAGLGAKTLGDLASRATGVASAQASKTSDLSTLAYDLNNDDLSHVASYLMEKPGLQADAANLQQALVSGNSYNKNAALFTILQKPEGRAALRAVPTK